MALAATLALGLAWVAIRHSSNPPAPAAQTEAEPQHSAAAKRTPRLPAPRVSTPAQTADLAVESPLATNIIARLLRGDCPKLTAEQVDAFLTKNNRSVESLLGAFDATGDRAFLGEAAEKFPGDPRVNFTAFFRADDHDNAKPASPERRQRLEAFAKAAPDNSMANYFLALDDFKAGRTDDAVQQLLAAAQKPKFQDYSLDFIQNAEDAYRAAGWSEADAKAAAAFGLALPQLAELKQTGMRIAELAQLYRQNDDEPSAQAALQLGLDLGQRLDNSGQFALIQELVGYAIERKMLDMMDPASVLANGGQTVQGRLDAITQRRNTIKETTPRLEALLPTLSEPDLVSYLDRTKLLGEEAATQWLLRSRGL